VVVNPWTNVHKLYSPDMIQLYLSQRRLANGGSGARSELPPHIYAVAQQAYDGVVASTALNSTATGGKCGQAILIT